MNRDFKFRAFNHIAKQMYYEAKLGDVFKWHNEGQVQSIMQYTGLSLAKKSDGFNKDGNWKTYIDLWENDIVELKADPVFYVGGNYKVGMRFVCKYLNNAFVFLPAINFEEYVKHGGTACSIQGTNPLNSYQSYNISNHFEIIGNIYEQPKLLTIK